MRFQLFDEEFTRRRAEVGGRSPISKFAKVRWVAYVFARHSPPIRRAHMMEQCAGNAELLRWWGIEAYRNINRTNFRFVKDPV